MSVHPPVHPRPSPSFSPSVPRACPSPPPLQGGTGGWTHRRTRPEGAENRKPSEDTFRPIGELIADVIDKCAEAYRARIALGIEEHSSSVQPQAGHERHALEDPPAQAAE